MMDLVRNAEANAIYKMNLSGGQRRLKEAVLYVCSRSNGMERFGAVKLNKILWRADFRSYHIRATAVTGRQYQRLPMGPAPVEMPPIIAEMLREKIIEIERHQVGAYVERRHVALVDPVLNLFSKDDIEFLDESISHYWNMTGIESSDQSHGVAWKTRENGDPIPYQAAYFEDSPLPPQTLNKLAAMARKEGWWSY